VVSKAIARFGWRLSPDDALREQSAAIQNQLSGFDCAPGAPSYNKTMSVEVVLKQACALPLAERIELCRNLWERIVESDELTPGEAALIDGRLQDHVGHPEDVVAWEQVKARLDAKYGK
jgi:putative addiction module component (TIGR02574 family)